MQEKEDKACENNEQGSEQKIRITGERFNYIIPVDGKALCHANIQIPSRIRRHDGTQEKKRQ
jgi:hypothetical protein